MRVRLIIVFVFELVLFVESINIEWRIFIIEYLGLWKGCFVEVGK